MMLPCRVSSCTASQKGFGNSFRRKTDYLIGIFKASVGNGVISFQLSGLLQFWSV